MRPKRVVFLLVIAILVLTVVIAITLREKDIQCGAPADGCTLSSSLMVGPGILFLLFILGLVGMIIEIQDRKSP